MEEERENKLKERKVSWAKLRRVDSLNLEAGRVSTTQRQLSWKVTLSLAFQSIGIVYGDIGTSPLYVYASTFTEGIKNNDDILGVLSLIIYTIVLIPMLKYVFIVLWANDNGNDPLYWPTFVVAVAAAIIASQAMISGAFSIISQGLNLGCFPRVRVVHTSTKHEGQVYIPEVNYMFMIACVVVSAAFRTTENISHAYGIAVVCDMLITTSLVSLIMLIIWKASIWQIVLFFVAFGFTEALYLSSVLYKFTQGGFLPLVSALFLTMVMGIWHYVHKERYIFELQNKVSTDYLKEMKNINRVPGIGLLYSELVQGIPPIFPHFIANVPSIHSVVVFVSIKSIPVSKVAVEERFLFRQVEPREHRMFRCVVRYGYNDLNEEPEVFEAELVQHLKEFIRQEELMMVVEEADERITATATATEQVDIETETTQSDRESQGISRASSDSTVNKSSSNAISFAAAPPPPTLQGAEDEIKFVEKAMEKGVVYLLGEAEVVARPNSSILNKIVVNYAYSFLRKNFRQGDKLMAIPRSRLLKVGMTYEI
ncbi:potassium transporter 5-like [Senna tora]|uniref:Potassium transporter 5-like n=1 Tax=Senna tora TaxID=362788 RepID=A0A835CFD3_9FABA|nr:potassium transporter 5-like [Senna tora]